MSSASPRLPVIAASAQQAVLLVLEERVERLRRIGRRVLTDPTRLRAATSPIELFNAAGPGTCSRSVDPDPRPSRHSAMLSVEAVALLVGITWLAVGIGWS